MINAVDYVMSLSHRKHAIFCVDVNEHNGKICRQYAYKLKFLGEKS